MRRQRKGHQLAAVNVPFAREEQVVAAGVVAVLGWRAHRANASGHHHVCLPRARERRTVASAHEYDG